MKKTVIPSFAQEIVCVVKVTVFPVMVAVVSFYVWNLCSEKMTESQNGEGWKGPLWVI